MRKAMVVVTAAMVGVTFVSQVRADDRPERTAKGVPVAFRPASTTAVEGFERMTLRDDTVVHVSSRVLFTRDDVLSAEALEAGDAQAIELSLTAEASQRLATAVRNGSADRLAIFVNRRLTAAPVLDSITAEGRATVTGLSSNQVSRLSPLLKVGARLPAGPVVRVVPREAAGGPGDLFTVDVFVRGVVGLRTYQVVLDVAGGHQGALTREEARIEAERADYVFGTAAVVKAVDDTRGRMGGVLFDGSVDAAAPVYLGTYSFRASDDSGGKFTITPRVPDTFLADPDSKKIPFRSQGATITVGSG